MGVLCGDSVVAMSDWLMKVNKDDDHLKGFGVSVGEGRDKIKTRPNCAILVSKRWGEIVQ